MIATWMLYATGTGLLFGLAALAAERICLATHRPLRWPWVTALVASLILPIALAGTPGLVPAVRSAPSAALIAELLPMPVTGLPGPAAFEPGPALSLERLLALGWLLGSTLMIAWIMLSVRSLERQRRTWRHGTLAGAPVRLSANTGPAVVGFLWQELVIPHRFLSWDEDSQRLLVEHEMEHERAGDPYLLLLSLIAISFMPWNAPLWWQARRLRFALEVDCDARVLRQRPCLDSYARLLIEVGRSTSTGLFPVAAFSETRSLLERRIRILAVPVRRPGASILLVLFLAMALAPLTVYSVPAPQRPDLGRPWTSGRETETGGLPGAPRAAPELVDSHSVVGRAPTFTPYEIAPELRNRSELGAALARGRTGQAQPAVAGRTAVLWVFVAATGNVTNTRLVRSSGDSGLDRVAEQALRQTARFAPARENGRRVPAWIQFPVMFDAPEARDERAGTYSIPIATTPLPPPPSGGAAAERARLPAYDTQPEIADRAGFATRMTRSYPPALEQAGVGGTAVLWAFVDKSGAVRNTRLSTSSGHEELDLVARELIRQSRFTPARDEGRAVGAWVQLPVRLRPR